jgi:lipopolysaccharide transport system permease protein
MAEVTAPAYEVVIEPSRGWIRLPWREFWEYRDLLVLLVRRDFIARYKQTLLGPAWFILQPVLTALVFVVVFARMAGIPTDGIPSPLFYLCGLLGWSYFSQNVTTAGATFINNASLFGKVYFPRLIVPVAVIASNFIAFALQFIPFLAFFAYYKFFTNEADALHFGAHTLLLPLPILHTAALSLGVSLWMAATSAKYRDLVHLNTFLLQLWMFATPIIYPLSSANEKGELVKWLLWLNPMSVPTEQFRWCLLGRGTLDPAAVAVSLVITVVLLVTGIIAFQKVERTVVDSV